MISCFQEENCKRYTCKSNFLWIHVWVFGGDKKNKHEIYIPEWVTRAFLIYWNSFLMLPYDDLGNHYYSTIAVYIPLLMASVIYPVAAPSQLLGAMLNHDRLLWSFDVTIKTSRKNCESFLLIQSLY